MSEDTENGAHASLTGKADRPVLGHVRQRLNGGEWVGSGWSGFWAFNGASGPSAERCTRSLAGCARLEKNYTYLV